MNMKPLLVLAGASLLAGCVYAGPPGVYSNSGYASPSPNYYGYQQTYQPGYQPGYRAAYQPTYQPAQVTYQQSYQPAYQPAQATYQYNRPAAYPFYSPQYPPTDSGGNGG